MNHIGNEWWCFSKVKLFETVIPICPPACDTYNYSSGAVKQAFSKFKKIKCCKNDQRNDSNDTSLFQMGAATFLATLVLSLFATLHFFGRRWRWWDNEIDYWPQMAVVHHPLKNSASPFALSGGLIFYSPLKSSNINHRASSPCESISPPPFLLFYTCVL